MRVDLFSSTSLNPGCYSFSDLSVLEKAAGTPADIVIEYGGRLCYHSTDKMGHSPVFIQKRMDEGHYDIAEHGWASLLVIDFPVLELRLPNRYIEVSTGPYGDHLVSGNLRAWVDFLGSMRANGHHEFAEQAREALALVSPSLFGDANGRHPTSVRYSIAQPKPHCFGNTGLGVALVSGTFPPALKEEQAAHNSCTFLVEGLSLTASHQFVRHRAMSFSQVSMRYTEPGKTQLGTVLPLAVQEKPEMASMVLEHYKASENLYYALRDSKVRKEDARFVLPTASKTRFLVTGNIPAWRHFLGLRLAKDAQWEIRQSAEFIEQCLIEFYPKFFG